MKIEEFYTMFPRTKFGEEKVRKHIRKMEALLTIETIPKFLKNDLSNNKKPDILEFGSGYGYQIPYLQQIGNVVASDIYISDNIKKMKDVNFVECSIINTPFHKEQFDVVFSSNVIEHIEDIPRAFDELKRIGKPDCIYAFVVITNIWLLLSIPAQYYIKVRGIIRILSSKSHDNKMNKPDLADNTDNNRKGRTKDIIDKLSYLIFPQGHGVCSGFINCYRSFRIKKWRQLFLDNGFSIIKTRPLLLYGAPEWPIIPPTKLFNRLNICSSMLFLMKK